MRTDPRNRLVAFLRGINLGNRRLTNDELRGAVEAGGFEGVAVYQASGNVVFDDPDDAPDDHRDDHPDAVAARLAAHLEDALGYPVDTFVRTMAELADVVEWAAPLADRAEGFKAHVIFLGAAPGAGIRGHLDALETDDDRLHVRGREVCWLRRGGLSSAEITAFGPGGITRGETGTQRTLGTVRRILGKFGPG